MRLFAWGLLVVGAVAAAIAAIVTRLSNPALTETQLLIQFWWLYVPIVAVAMIAALVVRRYG